MNEKYPEMNEKIWSYLVENEKNTDVDVFFPTYLAFCISRTDQILKMEDNRLLINILGKVIEIMKKDDSNPESDTKHQISDTF